jgi:hypothetical protein
MRLKKGVMRRSDDRDVVFRGPESQEAKGSNLARDSLIYIRELRDEI